MTLDLNHIIVIFQCSNWELRRINLPAAWRQRQSLKHGRSDAFISSATSPFITCHHWEYEDKIKATEKRKISIKNSWGTLWQSRNFIARRGRGHLSYIYSTHCQWKLFGLERDRKDKCKAAIVPSFPSPWWQLDAKISQRVDRDLPLILMLFVILSLPSLFFFFLSFGIPGGEGTGASWWI